jgi:uncharacterized membrane protein
MCYQVSGVNFEAGYVVIAWTLLAYSMKISLDTWAMHCIGITINVCNLELPTIAYLKWSMI